MPVKTATGYDGLTMFRSYLLQTQQDGPELISALARLTSVHPLIGAGLAHTGLLGEISKGRAVDCLRTYMATGVAMAPDSL